MLIKLHSSINRISIDNSIANMNHLLQYVLYFIYICIISNVSNFKTVS